ncbi:MBL fold metallo-hydrolase [Nocardioides insulae]|uniref:MBL fold metallo-hydrolase n=1 Tax=Nocardioides insulae TaxID=394734 RepID=UPI001B7FB85D|nr:MBL fold metallo-hydrolase [Nocardioides insulae]
MTTLIDNSSDALLPDQDDVRRRGSVGASAPLAVQPSRVAQEGQTLDLLRAEHGFSALVEVVIDGHRRRILYDAGPSPDGLVGNLDRLGLDPTTFETIVLSHGHFDHVMGLQGLARRLDGPTPLVVHPDAWRRRRIVGAGGSCDLPTPSRRALEGLGYLVIEERGPSYLLEGALLVTGRVDRETDFELGIPGQYAWLDGAWVADPLTHDDQAVVLNLRDRGLVVLTGCAHAGLVNTVRFAQRLTGIARIHAVLGGLHLRPGPTLAPSVAALVEIDPAVVGPAHCTSWEGHHALVTSLGRAYRANSVGSTFTLGPIAPEHPSAPARRSARR